LLAINKSDLFVNYIRLDPANGNSAYWHINRKA